MTAAPLKKFFDYILKLIGLLHSYGNLPSNCGGKARRNVNREE